MGAEGIAIGAKGIAMGSEGVALNNYQQKVTPMELKGSKCEKDGIAT